VDCPHVRVLRCYRAKIARLLANAETSIVRGYEASALVSEAGLLDALLEGIDRAQAAEDGSVFDWKRLTVEEAVMLQALATKMTSAEDVAATPATCACEIHEQVRAVTERLADMIEWDNVPFYEVARVSKAARQMHRWAIGLTPERKDGGCDASRLTIDECRIMERLLSKACAA
jgi:hypothetical protein